LDLPPESTKGASAAETKMAVQLVKDMSAPWKPGDFEDEFKHKVMELVHKKVKAGKTETVIEPEEEAPGEGAQVIDLSELLKRSLKGGGSSRKTSTAKKTSAAQATKKSPAVKKGSPKRRTPAQRTAA
jgi:DNA end-binding protein Ku